jgi:D-3-phosphoglycerate dehydrogenase
MSRKTFLILNLEPKGYSLKAQAILESFAQVINGPLDRNDLLEQVKDYDILIVRLNHRIDATVMNVASRLKVIVTASTGLNHIDIDEAEKRGIAVVSLKGERKFLDNIHATAEHTWGLLLALIRKLPQAHEHVLSGGWERDRFKGVELHGRTLGVIGLGRLGIKVSGYGVAFGMSVIGCDNNKPETLPLGVELASFDEVLRKSDVISIHVNYTSKNHAMIGRSELLKMKKASLLINTSRGELIDETALVSCLENGHLGGAALDVLCGENTVWENSSDILNYARNKENLILTPHIGGCTYDSMEKTEIFVAKKLLTYLKKVG